MRTTNENDLDVLVKSAADGSRGAIEEVLCWIRPLVVRYCRARVGDQEAFASVNDVAQQVCLAVFTALPNYRDHGRSFLAFVYGITAHRMADTYPSTARNRAKPGPEIRDSPDLAQQRAVQGELAERMNKLLGILPDKQREVLLLRVAVGLTAEETAETVGSTPGAIRRAQHHALGRLRNTLASEELP
ncbi:MAG: RNA polymerase sigma factor ShbA [Pseudonocardiaceae bacterium]